MTVERRLVAAIVALAALGAAGGVALNELLLIRYHATILVEPFITDSSIQDGRLYRRVQARMFSAERFRAFAAKSGDPETIEKIERAIAEADVRVLRFEYNFGVSKSDLRDLPEPIAKEVSAQVVKEAISIGSAITASDGDRTVAADMAKTVAAYMTDVAARLQLSEQARIWAVESLNETTGFKAAILDRKAKLDSLDRRLAAMRPLRDRDRSTQSTPGSDPSVQVQVTGPRYLSVAQQMTALETERIDLEEDLRQLEQSMARAAVNKWIGDVLTPIADSDASAQVAVSAALAAYQAERPKILATASGDRLTVELGLAMMERFLVAQKTRYVSDKVPVLTIRREGPRRLLAASTGAAAALALSYALWVARRRAAAEKSA